MRKREKVYLLQRPSRCTCGAARIVAHDNITTKYYGVVKIFRCTGCRRYFYIYTSDVIRLLAAAGIREHWKGLTQIMGLIALGLPLTQIESLMGRKSETIWARLNECRASLPLWKDITSALKAQWKFDDGDIAMLNSFNPRSKDRDSLYHVSFIATPKPNIGCDASLIKQRDLVRTRVEEILQREIAYTGAGELSFADSDVGKINWVRMIRVAHPDQLKELEEPDYEIAMQVRQPNAESREIAHIKAKVKGIAPTMSLAALCEGFYRKVPLPVFFDDIKQIAKSLQVWAEMR